MAWRWPAAVALIVVTAGLAGCIGGNDETGPNDTPGDALAGTTSDQGGADDLAGSNMTTLNYPVEPGLNTTIWANGSFAAQDNCFLVCQDGPSYHETELDGELAPGAVNRVTATLSFDRQNPILADALQVYGYAEAGTFYGYNVSQESGGGTFEALFVKDQSPLVVVVAYDGPPSAQPEVTYTLQVDVEIDPSVVPPGVPVELEAEPGQGFVFEAVGQSQGIEVLAYGPDDTLAGRLSSDTGRVDTSVPPMLDAGKHVLVPADDSAPIRLLTNGTTAEMRALHLTWEPGDLHPVEANEPVNWTFETKDVPLAVGMHMENGQPLAVSAGPGDAVIENPNGTPIDQSFGCGFCIAGGLFLSTVSPIGDEGLVAGTYTASYQPTAETGTAVGEVVITYER